MLTQNWLEPKKLQILTCLAPTATSTLCAAPTRLPQNHLRLLFAKPPSLSDGKQPKDRPRELVDCPFQNEKRGGRGARRPRDSAGWLRWVRGGRGRRGEEGGVKINQIPHPQARNRRARYRRGGSSKACEAGRAWGDRARSGQAGPSATRGPWGEPRVHLL